MKKLLLQILLILTALLCQNCIKYKQNKGFISPKTHEFTVDFTTNKGVIFIPVEFEGSKKNFMLDTGDDLTTLNRKEWKGKTTKISSSTGEKVTVGIETIDLLKIGDLEFKKISARNQNFGALEASYPNFGGLIGQSIISKTNWLIDYPNQKITISPKDLAGGDFETISMKNIRDPKLEFNYEGQTYAAFVDLGSSTSFSVTDGSDLAKKLMARYSFKENTRQIITASGKSQTITEKVGIVSEIKIGSVVFNNIETSIRTSSSQSIRIGSPFFKSKKLYIDNKNGVYKLK